ncbi:MAG: glycine/betaine ABC transporter, partial [Gammaproteobacteria bacterium]|nr:glycine/betaine ABC transporter [Gammaproteobacteria bacterium]
MIETLRQRKYLQFILLVVFFLILCAVITPSEGNWFWRLPPLIRELPLFINESVYYILYDWWLIDVWDPDIEEYEEKPFMNQVTRSVSGVILFMIEFVREIMLGGVKTIVTFTGWDWATENEWARWPALPWTVVAGGAAILGYALKGPRLALFAGATFCYIAIFGQWEPSMETLSFVLIAAPVSV